MPDAGVVALAVYDVGMTIVLLVVFAEDIGNGFRWLGRGLCDLAGAMRLIFQSPHRKDSPMNHHITADDLTNALNQKRDIDLVADGGTTVTYDALTQHFNVQGAGAIGISTPDPHEATEVFNRMVRSR
jgi:hypothetical protein